ncbi:MAG: ABC transporter ATP-binding protein [Kouleothrix sp.]|nr:ABC transporter ATP-binding protein [Kouleothrix sp.]
MIADYMPTLAATDYVTEPVVRMQGITKDFSTGASTFRALDDVSIEIQRGEMVAIMGPSGSGKSTLMTLIGLLDAPTGGSYWLDGQDVGGLGRLEQAHARNSKIGFVFQSFNLLPRLSALKNVELPLVYGRVPGREREARARAALESVGLASKLSNRPSELSGGQKQRVAVARALVGTPSMILADEPTGALDTRTGAEIMELFRALNREHGLTIVIVTHDPEIGRQMDRVIGLRDGRISQDVLSEYYNLELPGARSQKSADLVPVLRGELPKAA